MLTWVLAVMGAGAAGRGKEFGVCYDERLLEVGGFDRGGFESWRGRWGGANLWIRVSISGFRE